MAQTSAALTGCRCRAFAPLTQINDPVIGCGGRGRRCARHCGSAVVVRHRFTPQHYRDRHAQPSPTGAARVGKSERLPIEAPLLVATDRLNPVSPEEPTRASDLSACRCPQCRSTVLQVAEAVDLVDVLGTLLGVADPQTFLRSQAQHAHLPLMQVVMDLEGCRPGVVQ